MESDMQDPGQVPAARGRLGNLSKQAQLGQQTGLFKEVAVRQPFSNRQDNLIVLRTKRRLPGWTGQIEGTERPSMIDKRHAQERADLTQPGRKAELFPERLKVSNPQW